MAKTSKATKKFQLKHLKHTLDHRKKVQKHKKLVELHKRLGSGKAARAPGAVAENPAAREVFEDMLVDQFMEGGFEDGGSEDDAVELEEEESSEEEDAEEQMKGLEEADPEFYNYLKNNDKELLDFEGVNPMDAMSEDSEGEAVEEGVPAAADSDDEAADSSVEVTLQLVALWLQAFGRPKPNPKSIKEVVTAFKAAVHINDENLQQFKYSVTDADAFRELMVLALQKLPAAVQKLVPYKVLNNGARSVPQDKVYAKALRALAPALKLHGASLLAFLQDVSNTDTAALVLALVQELMPHFILHRRLLKELIGAVVGLWALTLEVETQVATFAFLNNAAREFRKSVLETTLRQTYLTFLKRCRQTNVHTMPLINFAKNSAAELYAIDPTLLYQVAFEFVRQLAIHLRNLILQTLNAKEGYRTIYNWQYVHLLDFWSRVVALQLRLSERPEQLPLRELVYPLVQVTMGTIRLVPTPQFFPLRFYLIRLLVRLLQATGVYIPLFPLLNELLTLSAFSKPGRRSTQGGNLPAVDFDHNIKVTQLYLGTKVYQDGLADQFVELTAEVFGLYATLIAFPEMVTPCVILLRRFIKRSKNARLNRGLLQLVEKLNQNSNLVLQKRRNVLFGPNSPQAMAQFMSDYSWSKTPLGAYVEVQRQAKEERDRLVRELLEENERREKEMKEREDAGEEDAEEEEGSSDAESAASASASDSE